MQTDTELFRVYHLLCVPISQMEQHILVLQTHYWRITHTHITAILQNKNTVAHCTEWLHFRV